MCSFHPTVGTWNPLSRGSRPHPNWRVAVIVSEPQFKYRDAFSHFCSPSHAPTLTTNSYSRRLVVYSLAGRELYLIALTSDIYFSSLHQCLQPSLGYSQIYFAFRFLSSIFGYGSPQALNTYTCPARTLLRCSSQPWNPRLRFLVERFRNTCRTNHVPRSYEAHIKKCGRLGKVGEEPEIGSRVQVWWERRLEEEGDGYELVSSALLLLLVMLTLRLSITNQNGDSRCVVCYSRCDALC